MHELVANGDLSLAFLSCSGADQLADLGAWCCTSFFTTGIQPMHKLFNRASWRRMLANSLGLMLTAVALTAPIHAQDDAPPPKPDTAEATADDAEVDERFIIPEGASVAELFEFIDKTKSITPTKRDPESIAALAKQVFPTIIAAADLVLEKSKDPDELARAVKAQFDAYGILVRFDPSSRDKVKTLAETYAAHESPELAATAVGFLLNEKASGLRNSTEEEAKAISAETLDFLKRFGPSKQTYSTTAGIARNLAYSDHPQIAADLYESMAPIFRDAEDESLAETAESMLGSARRLRLLGNSIEVFGTTADGQPFEWSDYRGKVVLVDFWASWCGPCIGELPNMKKNLKLYADKGFEIVGINMDSTRDAYEKCVESKEITWVNLVSEEEGKTGWKAPMATHYGITGIPTAILVDQEGKVVSLNARGKELDKQLESLLGPVEEPAEDPAESTDEPQASGKPE